MARVDRFLDDDLAVGTFVHDAAERGVFALGVLAHHEVVDVTGLAAGQWAGHAFKQAHGAQVDVLVELAAELEQRAPQRDVVGHGGRPAHGAEQDGIEALQLGFPVVGHHLAVLGKVIAMRPVEVLHLQRQVKASGSSFQHADPFGHHFLADAVASQYGDALFLAHGSSSRCLGGTASLRRQTYNGASLPFCKEDASFATHPSAIGMGCAAFAGQRVRLLRFSLICRVSPPISS
ncbi:hypothetical protein D3C72_1614470 [compost metagenome]